MRLLNSWRGGGGGFTEREWDRKSERAVCAYERKREERARERVSVSARVCEKGSGVCKRRTHWFPTLHKLKLLELLHSEKEEGGPHTFRKRVPGRSECE